jgi:hypothetical protein
VSGEAGTMSCLTRHGHGPPAAPADASGSGAHASALAPSGI